MWRVWMGRDSEEMLKGGGWSVGQLRVKRGKEKGREEKRELMSHITDVTRSHITSGLNVLVSEHRLCVCVCVCVCLCPPL